MEKERLPMAKRVRASGTQGDGKARATTRAKRYATLLDLRAAVCEKCLADIRSLAGNVRWLSGLPEYLESARTVDDRPRKVWRALMRALLDARDIALTQPQQTPYPNIYEKMLRQFVVDYPVAIAQALVERESLETDADVRGPENWPSTRVLLVRRLDHPEMLWWEGQDRRPTSRELALLTLIAGEWPEYAARQQRAGVAAGVSLLLPTVSEVIQAEVRAIERIRARHAERGAKHSPNG